MSGKAGLLLVDKPTGPTSHDVVQVARRALREKRIGHTGTLDPAATGLLVLCVGKATRLQGYLLAWEKAYEGEIRLGFATTTYDAEGEPLAPPRPVPPLTPQLLSELAQRFSGELQQLPPPFSAKKKDGKKFYELARAGEEVPREPKTVSISQLRLEALAEDRLGFSVVCSSGTYVRSLAHDIGEVLGCGGHLAHLRRVRVGPWRVESALAAEELAHRPLQLPEGAWVDLDRIELPFPVVHLNPVAVQHFARGQEVVVREVVGSFLPGSPVAVRDRAGRLVGIGQTTAYLPRARTLNLAPRTVLLEVEEGAKVC
ncbi:MAG: tRNA pseudouridine(55) synthase TruB [Thermoanaerobaculum sp.]|nr:tRNA pseudouridine(55) synthase TruB [Thermoanaerobaculum sp.]